ncbi:ABC transporter [Pseudonocardia sp. CNS-139]|nr:ABC transporter [Pseudonocardia sp. CNS-139]
MIRQLVDVLRPAERPVVRRGLVLIVIAAVVQGVTFGLLVPALDTLLGPRPALVWPWIGALLVAAAVHVVAHYVSLKATLGTGAVISRSLHQRIGDHMATLPLGWFEADRVGRLSMLVSQDVAAVMAVPAHMLRPVVAGVVTPVTVVAVMYVFDWRLALATTVTVPLIALVYRWSTRLAARADEIHGRTQGVVAGRVIEFAQLQPVLRAFGRSDHGTRLLDEALAAQRDSSRQVIVRGVPGLISFGLAIQAAFTVVLVLGVDLALGGTLSAGALIGLLALTARFVEPLSEAAGLGAALQRTRQALDRIEEVLHARPLPEPAAPRTPAGNDVELDDVGFAYVPGRPVLEHVGLTAPAGTLTALVGASGSGKTTVIRLIARFWDAGRGAVRIGGVDVRDIATEDLMARVAVVFQDVWLFEGTISDNIRLGREAATDDEVREAARLARVDEIVERLPAGWDTPVGEGGTRLSGGERQRVSIARAILKDAPIVLLDEATAALDPENESLVGEALRSLARNRTVIVIAHRLSTVVSADRIVVLDRGRVVEQGTHTELLDLGGRYARFWAERSQARGWRLEPADVGG